MRSSHIPHPRVCPTLEIEACLVKRKDGNLLDALRRQPFRFGNNGYPGMTKIYRALLTQIAQELIPLLLYAIVWPGLQTSPTHRPEIFTRVVALNTSISFMSSP